MTVRYLRDLIATRKYHTPEPFGLEEPNLVR